MSAIPPVPRAKFARIRAGFADPGKAAAAIGCSRPTVVNWEKGQEMKRSEFLLAAATVYRVRPDWLIYSAKDDGFPSSDRDGGLLPIPASETQPGYVRFQLLEGGGGMGDGLENQDYPEVIREVDVAEWEVRRKLGFLPTPGRIRMITGRGPSMRPMIDNGDVVMVDTAVAHFDGDAVYVINVGGETQIKMLQMRGDGLYVVSANADYPAYKVERNAGLHVGGKVSAVMGIKEL